MRSGLLIPEIRMANFWGRTPGCHFSPTRRAVLRNAAVFQIITRNDLEAQRACAVRSAQYAPG
jgi:hypothetical protein